MIKGIELRIGSWVYDTRTVGNRSGLPAVKTPTQVQIIENKDYNFYTPIPIFSSILINSRFEYRKQFNDWSIPFKSMMFSIGKSLFDDDTWYLCDYKANHSVEFKYIHQLQSLFFSITGQELEITI